MGCETSRFDAASIAHRSSPLRTSYANDPHRCERPRRRSSHGVRALWSAPVWRIQTSSALSSGRRSRQRRCDLPLRCSNAPTKRTYIPAWDHLEPWASRMECAAMACCARRWLQHAACGLGRNLKLPNFQGQGGQAPGVWGCALATWAAQGRHYYGRESVRRVRWQNRRESLLRSVLGLSLRLIILM
jgi:hypothetical protein